MKSENSIGAGCAESFHQTLHIIFGVAGSESHRTLISRRTKRVPRGSAFICVFVLTILAAGSAHAQLSELTAIPDTSQPTATADSQLATSASSPSSSIPNRIPAFGEEYTYLSAGLFVYSKTDLSLPGPMPINITRVYRSEDLTSGNYNNRAFGQGTRLNYNLFLTKPSSTEVDINMPDSSQLVCTNSHGTYPYTCNNQPAGVWFNSYFDSNQDLVRQDGTVYHFDSYGLLVSITDHYNNQITINRSNGSRNESTSCAGGGGHPIAAEYVYEISSSNGRAVYFCYDDTSNNQTKYDISEIFDNASPNPIKKVFYTYHDNVTPHGKLATVTQYNFNSNATTTYKYNQTTPSNETDITEIDVNDECQNNNWTSCTPNAVYTYVTYVQNNGMQLKSISSQLPGNGYTYGYTFTGGSNPYVDQVVVSLPDGSQRAFTFDAAGYVGNDYRDFGKSDQEETWFQRGQQTVGNSTEFVGEVDEMDSGGTIWRRTNYDYNSTTGDVLSVTLTPAPGQNDSGCTGGSCGSTHATWTYTYETPGSGHYNRLTSAAEPMAYNGVGTTYSYSGLTTTITDPLGRHTTITDNAEGQPAQITDNLSHTTTITYDGAGNVSSVTDPENNMTSFTPDADGRVSKVFSPMGEETDYTYDALDDVTSVKVDPSHLHLTMTYAYDLVGQLRSITTPNNNTTTITRYANLAKTTVTDPLGNTTFTDLDGQGRKTDYTDKRGIETTYKYDLFGRVTKTVFNANQPSGSPPQETVTVNGFDALDRATSITDSLTSTLTYSYDSLDSPLSEIDSATNDQMTYGYDSNGRRISMQGSMNGTMQPEITYGYDCADELIGATTAGNGYANPPNCSSSTDVTNGGGYNTQFIVNYDGDGMPSYTETDGITTDYAPRDADERVINENFLDPGNNSYGNLSYTYNADGEVIDKSGSLAVLNDPQPSTATYDANDQLLKWDGNCVISNGNCVTSDAASNIINDPASNYSLTWSSRNQVTSMTGLSNLSDTYDVGGRRDAESFYPYYGGLGSPCGTIPCTETLNFLHDGSSIAGWQSSLAGYQYQAVTGQWDFLEAGGATLAGSYTDTASQTTTNYVPLVDAAGTVIALVNPASPDQNPPPETITYDPSGTPSASGSANGWPFLYHGAEHESIDPNQYYYSGNGAYYSAQIMRSVSTTSAQGTSGPGGGPGSAGLPGISSGGVSFGSYAQSQAESGAIGAGAGLAAGGATLGVGAGASAAGIASAETAAAISSAAGPVGLIVGGAAFLGFLSYDLFGGGSPDYPSNYFTDLFRINRPRGGAHTLYPDMIGVPVKQLIVDQGPSANATPAPKRPLGKRNACPGDVLCNPTPTPQSAPGYPLGLGPNAIPPPKPQTEATYWSCVFGKLSTVQATSCIAAILYGATLPESGWKGGVKTAVSYGACAAIAKSCRDNPNQ